MGGILGRNSMSLQGAASFPPLDNEDESESDGEGSEDEGEGDDKALLKLLDFELDPRLAAIELLGPGHLRQHQEAHVGAMRNTHPVINDIYFDTRAMTEKDVIYNLSLPGMQDPDPIFTLTAKAESLKKAEVTVAPSAPLGNGFPGVSSSASVPINFNDNFDEILRLGMANKIEDRDQWIASIRKRSAEIDEQDKIDYEIRKAREAVDVNAKSIRRGIDGGIACAQKTLHEWPAGGMHEHG